MHSYAPSRLRSAAGDFWKNNRTDLLLCIFSVFAWGLLAHGYAFFNTILTHDGLNAFVADATEDAWKIRLGRYLVPLYRSLTRGRTALPWVIGVLGLFWTAAALFLIKRMLRIRSRLLTVLTAGIMATNITYIAQIATYHYEFDFNAFSLLLAVLAAWLWRSRAGLLPLFLGSACVAASMGLYQAYVAVSITLIIAASIQDLLDMKSPKDVLIHGLWAIAMLLFGAALYFGVQKLVLQQTGLALETRVSVFDKTAPVSPVLFTYSAAKFLIDTVGHKAYGSSFYGAAALLLAALSAVAAAIFFWRRKCGPGRFALALFLTAALPLGMIFPYLATRGEGVHELMVYSVWFFYVFLLLLSFRLCSLHPGWFTGVLRFCCCLLTAVLLWKNVLLANTAYVSKEMANVSTLSTMTRVLSDLEHREDYVYNETPVAFIGVYESPNDNLWKNHIMGIVGFERNSTFVWDSSEEYYNSYKAYFRNILQYPLSFCTDAQNAQLHEDPRVIQMPAFPNAGYMQMIDGILVVKFRQPLAE